MSLFGGSKAGKATSSAALTNMKYLGGLQDRGNETLSNLSDQGESLLRAAGETYAPLTALGQKGATLYADSLGLNGAEGNANATSAFQAAPGYTFAMDQGLGALERRAAAQGRLGSGQTGIDTLGFAQGLANQEFGNWQSQLGGYNGLYQSGIAGQAGALSDLAGFKAGVADRRIGFDSDVISGVMGAENQLAQGNEMRQAAKQQGLGSLLGLGGKLAGMVTGGAAGGPLAALGGAFGYGK